MASDRMSRQEWERIKVEDFERLEADLTTERARADALAIENAELRAAVGETEGVGTVRWYLRQSRAFYDGYRNDPETDARHRQIIVGLLNGLRNALAADPAQRGAELLAAADAMAADAIFSWPAGAGVIGAWCRICGSWPPSSPYEAHRTDCSVPAYRRLSLGRVPKDEP